jgi:hypothetical protein
LTDDQLDRITADSGFSQLPSVTLFLVNGSNGAGGANPFSPSLRLRQSPNVCVVSVTAPGQSEAAKAVALNWSFACNYSNWTRTSPMRNKLLPLAGTLTALRVGSAIASDTQEIAAAWSRYAEEVRRHTSEASQALLRVRTLKETLEVQARLLRDTMQSFRDQSLRMAETASRMATRPRNALKEASVEQTGD